MSYIPQHRSFTTKFKHLLEYLLLRFTVLFFNLLPLFLIDLLTTFSSKLIWYFFPFRINVAYDNLTTVFPSKTHSEKLGIVKNAYHRFVHAAGLIFVIHRPKVSELIDQAEISGLNILEEALTEDKGVILTTYHGCWFEAYFAWFSKGNHPTSLIYKRQKNPLCDAYFVKLRKRYGSNLNHIDKYEKLNEYREELQQKRILIVSLDQNYGGNGTPVSLFGSQFGCAKGTALLHLQTEAPILTSVYYVKNNKLHIDFDRVELPHYHDINDDNIKKITNLSIKGYEKTIQAYPDQWFSLFHRLWKKKGYPKNIHRSFKDILS